MYNEPQVENKENSKTFRRVKSSDKQNIIKRCPRKRTHFVQRNKYKTDYGLLI